MKTPGPPGLGARHGFRALGLLLSLAACGGVTSPDGGPDAGPLIQLDGTVYQWGNDSYVRYTVSNPHGAEVWLDCGAAGHQMYRAGWQWIEFPGCHLAETRPMVRLVDGFSGSLRLRSDNIPVEGHYRLVFELWRDADRTAMWPLPSRASAAFRVGP